MEGRGASQPPLMCLKQQRMVDSALCLFLNLCPVVAHGHCAVEHKCTWFAVRINAEVTHAFELNSEPCRGIRKCRFDKARNRFH